VKPGATLEPREKVNCGVVPRGAPNGKIGLEEAATPGAAVEATTGAGLGAALNSEVSPGAKGFGSEEAVVALDAKLGGRIPAAGKLEGGLTEVGRPPTAKVVGEMLEETAGAAVVSPELA
jgi:hypothetical protein